MFKNLFLYGLSEGLNKVTPFITSLLFAYFLSVEDFGYLALYIVAFELFFIFIANNIAAVYRVQFFKRSIKTISLLALAGLINSFKIGVVLFILTICLFQYYNFSALVLLFPLLGLARTISLIGLVQSQCKKKSSIYLNINLIYFMSFILSIWCFKDAGVEGWFYALIIATILQALYAFINVNDIKYNTKTINKCRRLIWPVFFIGVAFLPQAIGWWGKSGADRFIVEHVFGVVTLASYSLAYQLSAMLLVLVTVINLVFVPVLNDLLAKKMYCEVKRKINMITCLVLLAFLFIVTFGFLFLTSFFTEKYNDVQWYYLLLSASTLPFSLSLIYMNLYYFFGKQVLVAKIVTLSAISQLLLAYFIGVEFGILGYFCGAIIVNFIMLCYLVVNNKKVYKQ